MLNPDITEEALWGLLPALPQADLPALLDHPACHERHILKVLQKPDLPEEWLGLVCRSRWVRVPSVQSSLVNHPRTPRGEALNLVKFLFWRELNRTILNFRLAPEVRHSAEANLIQRLPAMAVGEKMTLARTTAGQVLKSLRSEGDPRVVKALLENPRAVEEDVLFLASRQQTPAPVLEMVAQDVRWNTRKEVRMALLRNARTPIAAALGFVSKLTAPDLRSLSTDPKVPLAVRRTILRRLGEG